MDNKRTVEEHASRMKENELTGRKSCDGLKCIECPNHNPEDMVNFCRLFTHKVRSIRIPEQEKSRMLRSMSASGQRLK